MRRFHLLSRVRLLVHNVLEHLSVRQHPVPVHQEEDWGVGKQPHGVLSHLVVHGRWKLVRVGDLVPLSGPENEVRKEGDREEGGESNTVHHRHVGHIQDIRELEVHNVAVSIVEVEELIDLLGLSGVDTIILATAAAPFFGVSGLAEPLQRIVDGLEDGWHERIRQHRLHEH